MEGAHALFQPTIKNARKARASKYQLYNGYELAVANVVVNNNLDHYLIVYNGDGFSRGRVVQ